jgi:hypothetical protein
MGKEEQVRNLLKKMASDVGPAQTILAVVKSVDEGAFTCDLIDDETELEFFDVRLRPVLDGNSGITLIPKVNAWALAVRIEDGDDWMLIAAGEYSKVLTVCENVVYNGGQKGGLVNWPDAKTQLDKSNQVIGIIMQTLLTWVPSPGDGGAALKTAMTTALAGKSIGTFVNLEDTRVKH